METKGNFSWIIHPEKMKEQVEGHDTLSFTKTYRGMSVLLMAFLLLFSFVIAYLGLFVEVSDVLLSLVIYIPVLYFVSIGNRLAIVILMLLWTLEKVVTAHSSYEMGENIYSSVIWWLAVMPVFFKALLVENEYKKARKTASLRAPGTFCSQCGAKAYEGDHFCRQCGKALSVQI